MEAITPPRLPKKIVLFSDGTGNSSAKAQKTNVWRLFQALDQRNPDQIAKYDDGVGTSSIKYLAILGGAFGWGLTRNVIDLYKFVCRNYARGDDIYGFGFSRGAFTIRVLVGLIVREGLVTFRSEEELDHHAAAAYRSYRYKAFPSKSPIVWCFRKLRDAFLYVRNRIQRHDSYGTIKAATTAAARDQIPIRFLGLWDTVEAYGMPIEELKRGIDWVLWPMLFGDLKLSLCVKRAVHALSLDDERTTFHPLLWDEEWEAESAAKIQLFPAASHKFGLPASTRTLAVVIRKIVSPSLLSNGSWPRPPTTASSSLQTRHENSLPRNPLTQGYTTPERDSPPTIDTRPAKPHDSPTKGPPCSRTSTGAF